MNNLTAAQQLQNVLDFLPARLQRRDITTRKAARVALDSLNAGNSEQRALEAVRDFLDSLRDTPAVPVPFLPQSRPKRPRAWL